MGALGSIDAAPSSFEATAVNSGFDLRGFSAVGRASDSCFGVKKANRVLLGLVVGVCEQNWGAFGVIHWQGMAKQLNCSSLIFNCE